MSDHATEDRGTALLPSARPAQDDLPAATGTAAPLPDPGEQTAADAAPLLPAGLGLPYPSGPASSPSAAATGPLSTGPLSTGSLSILPGAGAPPIEGDLAPGAAWESAPASRWARRGRSAALVAAGLASLTAGLAVGGALGRGFAGSSPTASASAPAVRAVVAAPRTQRTLLLSVDLGRGRALGALIATDPRGRRTSVTLLPSRTVAEVPGAGTLPLGRALRLPDAATSRATVSDLLGVTVDASWRLDQATLARLIDAGGGVTVDVDTDVLAADGTPLANPGPGQHLSGMAAAAFAATLAEGDDESVRLVRLQQVLAGLVAALPTQQSAVAARLASLGPGSTSTEPPLALAGQLGLLTAAGGTAGATGSPPATTYAVLPVLPVDSGGAAVAYRTDPAALASYRAQQLAGSEPHTAAVGVTRVFVINGTGAAQLGALVRPRLVAAGLSYVGSRNATTFGRATSAVLVGGDSAADRARGRAVATALGLPPSVIAVGSQEQDVADVVVLVGADLHL